MKSKKTVVQIIIYRVLDGRPEFLLLKRSAERGGFWNAVNGTLEPKEPLEAGRMRELQEESGIIDVVRWSGELYRFTFEHSGAPVEVKVFVAEVPPKTPVKINDESSTFRWVTFKNALALLKFEDDREALRRCYKYVTG